MNKNGNVHHTKALVTLQDSSPPSVVRRRFFVAGMAAAGCHARNKSRREPPEGRGSRHLDSYSHCLLAKNYGKLYFIAKSGQLQISDQPERIVANILRSTDSNRESRNLHLYCSL